MSYNNSILAINGSYDFPCPSGMTWGKQDISDSDSGRAQYTGYMYKNKIGEKRKLSLSWKALNKDECHAVLSKFKDEYFMATFFDPMEGQDVTKEFYCGDMSAPVKFWFKKDEKKLYGDVTFNIIER